VSIFGIILGDSGDIKGTAVSQLGVAVLNKPNNLLLNIRIEVTESTGNSRLFRTHTSWSRTIRTVSSSRVQFLSKRGLAYYRLQH